MVVGRISDSSIYMLRTCFKFTYIIVDEHD